MKWINKLERKFGKYAIPNLMVYIIALYAVGFVISMVNPVFYYSFLDLRASKILDGEIWRIVTFLMMPPNSSTIFVIFALYLYYMIGNSLESAWGAFRFNLYFFTGVLFHIIAAFLVYFIFHSDFLFSTFYLNLSLFFAFAALYPNLQFLLFFVIPVKVKYLAWLDAAYFGFTILQAFISPTYATIGNSIAAVVSLANFLLFFFGTRNYNRISPREVRRKAAYKKQVKEHKGTAKHKCAICGRTEEDGDHLEFRFCSKCDGNYEYCQDHLFTHEHRKK